MSLQPAPRREYVYLDHAATSPLRPEARDAMEPFHDVAYANPSGAHRFAREVRKVIDEARDMVAEAIGCLPGEVVFTSGGTEGANTAILGAVRRHNGRAVCSAAEHHAVLHCVEHVDGVVLPVTEHGVIDPVALRETLRDTDNVSVMSAMAVNNEVGAITDIVEVSRAVRRTHPDAIMHTDAVQAACWIDLREVWPHVDVMTLSAHKFGGPKGMGIMVVRDGVHVEPLILGGGQERDRRSGTHNVAGIVGTAVALSLTHEHRQQDVARLRHLREHLVKGITEAVSCATATLPSEESVAGIAHLCLEGIESEPLLFLLDKEDFCASAASACASGAMEPSHVLAAMGVETERAKGALRLSLGHTTTQHDVDRAITVVAGAVSYLQEMSERTRARAQSGTQAGAQRS
jgi:cysteine desulfurase